MKKALMGKSKLVNVIKKISIGFAVFFAVFVVIGFVSLFYNSYKCTRVPIYQTTMTDFELVVQPEGRSDDSRSEEQHNLQNLIDKFEIITLQCFVFQGHPQRPSYCILLVGTLPTDADFSEYSLEKHPLKSGERVFSALKLCGAEPMENEEYLEFSHSFIFGYQIYIYHDRIIFVTWANNPTYLLRDEQKREFLGKYIVPREKEAVENATPYAPQKYVYLETGFGGPTEQIVIDLENEKITYEFSRFSLSLRAYLAATSTKMFNARAEYLAVESQSVSKLSQKSISGDERLIEHFLVKRHNHVFSLTFGYRFQL